MFGTGGVYCTNMVASVKTSGIELVGSEVDNAWGGDCEKVCSQKKRRMLG